MEFILKGMTPAEMEESATSLADCVRNGHYEDAMNHLTALMWAVNRAQVRDAVDIREAVRKMAMKMGMRAVE